MTTPRELGRRSSMRGSDWDESNMMYEVQRLRNELRAKEREVEERGAEIRTLKGAMAMQDKALERAEGQLAEAKDRLLGLEGSNLSLKRSLAKAEAEREGYRREAETANREADRLTAQVAAVPSDAGYPEEIRRLEARVGQLQEENKALADDNKACYNVIRSKEKELARQSKKLGDAEEAVLARKEAENVIADLKRQLGEAKEEISMLQRMQRLKEAEVQDAGRDAGKTLRELQTTSEYLAAVTAELQLTKANLQESKTEAAVLRDELARVSAVASRVARAELRGGGKDEGTIPILMHLEEVKYMQGEIHRLKQKLEYSERSVQSAQQQRERLYRRIDALAAASEAMGEDRRRASLLGSPRGVGTPRAGTLSEGEGSLDDLALDSPADIIRELRAQVAELREDAAMKGQEASLLSAQLQDRAQCLDDARSQMVKLKGRLCEALGDEAYMREFGEPPPALEAAAEAEVAPIATPGASLQAEVAIELQRALQDLSQQEEAAASLQQQLEETQATREQLQQQLDEAEGAKQGLEQRLEEAELARQEAEQQLEQAQAAREQLQQQLEEAEGAQQEAQQAQQAQQEAEQALQQRLEEAELARLEVEQQLEEAQQAQQEAQQAQQEAEQALEEAEGARRQLEGRLHAAESLADAASGEVESLQEQLEALQQRLAEAESSGGGGSGVFVGAAAVAGAAAGAAAGLGASSGAEAGLHAAGPGGPGDSAAATAAAALAEQHHHHQQQQQQQEGGSGAARGATASGAGAAAGLAAAAAGDGGTLSVADEERGGCQEEEEGGEVQKLRGELAEERQRVGGLQSQLAEVQAQLEAAQHQLGVLSEEEDEEEGAPSGHPSPGAPAALAPATSDTPDAAGVAASPEALADLVERLLRQREQQRAGGPGPVDDGALFDEMTAMLKGELARLGKEMVEREAKAERLRSEVGSLEAAKLTAEAVASRLEEMNELSMRVAALKIEMSRQAAEQEEREAALLQEVSQLRSQLEAKRRSPKKSPTKTLKKTLTQSFKGFRESLSPAKQQPVGLAD